MTETLQGRAVKVALKKKTNLKHQWCHPGALDGVSRVTAPHIPVMLHGAGLTRTPLAWLQLARESIKM